MFTTILKTDGTNNTFKIHKNKIYICSDKKIMLVDLKTHDMLASREILPKNGKSRGFIIDGNMMFFREFCTCYAIDMGSLNIVHTWQLGHDLTSDICGICGDETHYYAGIRNGPLAIINKETNRVQYHQVSESSIWTIEADDFIYAGNVHGDLLKIDRTAYTLVNHMPIHKKNLKSMLLTNNKLYTASQDLSFAVIDKETLNVIDRYKKCHRKMFYLVGTWRDYVLTASVPCGEMKVWDITNHTLYRTLDKATWHMTISGDKLYIMDAGTLSFIDLQQLLEKN